MGVLGGLVASKWLPIIIAAGLGAAYLLYRVQAGSSASSGANGAGQTLGASNDGSGASSGSASGDLAQPLSLPIPSLTFTPPLGTVGSQTSPGPGPAPVGSAVSAGQTVPLYAGGSSPTGYYTVGPSGASQPAYVGPGGGYVSPQTYAGLGVTPSAIVGPGSGTGLGTVAGSGPITPGKAPVG